ncbi:MAG: hypothetical protein AYK22_02325 [Thermoplasmatales archaeon SG8-52-3]|nr:MAG: hypothetical protein AYK22_02325 [Thermoplasmatales archaeon SG8-52-3]
MNYENNEKTMNITSCNDHLGGLLGESLLRFFLKENLIQLIGNDYFITQKGWDELEIIGIDVDKLRSEKRNKISICFESNHGILYEHLGSYLGSLLMQRIIELGWIKKKNEKIFMLTEKGFSGLESMGIRIKSAALRQKSLI